MLWVGNTDIGIGCFCFGGIFNDEEGFWFSMNLVMIALGGALGAVSRFLLGNAVSRAVCSALPYGTFVINVLGCFAMGLLMTIIVDREMLPAAWRLFLCAGFLGGFTTFSSFGYEALILLMEGRILAVLAYVGGSVVLGLLAAGAGVLCGRAV